MKQLFIQLIKKYQRSWSPYLAERGVRCLYEPSCSQYALESFNSHSTFVALGMTVARLLSCNPINAYLKTKKGELYGKRI